MSGDLYYSVLVTAGCAQYDLAPDLRAFVIEEDRATPDKLTVELTDPYKVLGHALQPGMEIEVDLGTLDDHSLIFRGRIYKVEGNFQSGSLPTLKIQAYDRSMAMGLRVRNRTFSRTAAPHGFDIPVI